MAQQTLRFVTLDVFTSNIYAGNSLALVQIPSHLKGWITKEQKQKIAKEFNLSETIFVHLPFEDGKFIEEKQERNESPTEWEVEIFTPNEELPFAGHPTIGAAFYLLHLQHPVSYAGKHNKIEAALLTRAGRIPISLMPVIDGSGIKVQASIPYNIHVHTRTLSSLSLPSPPSDRQAEIRDRELKAPIVSIVKGMTFLLIRLPDLETLGRLSVLKNACQECGIEGLLDTEDGWGESFVGRYYYVVVSESRVSGGTSRFKIRTRMIEAQMEDPATGSAASTLCAYLSLKDGMDSGKYIFEIEQGVEMERRSIIGVQVLLDGNGKGVESLELNGSAVIVMEGQVRIES